MSIGATRCRANDGAERRHRDPRSSVGLKFGRLVFFVIAISDLAAFVASATGKAERAIRHIAHLRKLDSA
jgi:hypothetical protein